MRDFLEGVNRRSIDRITHNLVMKDEGEGIRASDNIQSVLKIFSEVEPSAKERNDFAKLVARVKGIDRIQDIPAPGNEKKRRSSSTVGGKDESLSGIEELAAQRIALANAGLLPNFSSQVINSDFTPEPENPLEGLFG